MRTRIWIVATLAGAACGGKYKAPPSVPSMTMPSGAALKPFDATKPGLARPTGMLLLNGAVYVALGNYDASYAVRGPGLLAVVDPRTGTQSSLIDLGGSDGHQCLSAYTVRQSNGLLYVTCTGDFSTGAGQAIVEVDPAAGKVTRTAKLPTSPSGLAITSARVWFGDALSGKVYAIDRSSFALAAGPLSLPCPTTGTYLTTNDVMLIQGDVYAACSNSTGGVLARLDPASGALKMKVDSGPTAVAFTETYDGRIAIVSGADNKLRLVTVGASALTASEAYTFSSATNTLQDVRASGQFLFTTASGTNTVQRLDLTRTGAQMLVGEATVGVNATPYNILPLDDDQALVSNQGANTIVSVSSDCSGGRVCWAVPK